MKEKISKNINWNKLPKDIKNNLTVFEPKYPLGDLYKTDAIPSSHKACLNDKGLKSYIKDSPVCLDLACFQPKNKTDK